LKEENSPNWADNFHVQEQRPHAPHGEIGNQRKKLDIFICGNREEGNLNFCFETKRLNKTTGDEDYFGNNGIQRFLSGIYPINACGEAAMIGYIQTENVLHWKKWLKEELINSKFRKNSIIPELEDTFRTCHQSLSTNEGDVVLFHVLLNFCR
jgi:hypothetical protein